MKRFVRVWRVAALVFLGLAVITALYFWISGAPHHAALKRFYDYVGILSILPPPKFFLLNFIFLLVEIPFLIGIGDGKDVFPPRTRPSSDLTAKAANSSETDAKAAVSEDENADAAETAVQDETKGSSPNEAEH